jgi:hypothetical protein
LKLTTLHQGKFSGGVWTPHLCATIKRKEMKSLRNILKGRTQIKKEDITIIKLALRDTAIGMTIYTVISIIIIINII